MPNPALDVFDGPPTRSILPLTSEPNYSEALALSRHHVRIR